MGKPLKVLLGAWFLTVGCSAESSCPSAEPRRAVDSGSTDLQALVYESAPWDGPLARFPAQSELVFVHHLGVIPYSVGTYLSFSETGSAGSSLSENAGNQGLIECVDDQVIRVKNDTCVSESFIRVVATARPSGGVSVTPCE